MKDWLLCLPVYQNSLASQFTKDSVSGAGMKKEACSMVYLTLTSVIPGSLKLLIRGVTVCWCTMLRKFDLDLVISLWCY